MERNSSIALARGTHVDMWGKVHDSVRDNLLQLLFGHTKSRMNLIKRMHEIIPINAHVLHIVRDTSSSADLDMSIERKGRSRFD